MSGSSHGQVRGRAAAAVGAAVLCLLGCKSSVGADAGSVVDAGPGLPATDLRSALLLTVPEVRGMTGLVAIAVVEQTLAEDPARGGDLEAALRPYFAGLRLNAAHADGGTLIAQNAPFFVEAERRDGSPVVRVALVVKGEQYTELLSSPAPMTTEHLARLLPLPPGTKVLRENFQFEVHYQAKGEHAQALIQQLVRSLLAAGWKQDGWPEGFQTAQQDGGGATTPEHLSLTLREKDHGGEIKVGRDAERVVVTWTQPLVR